MLTNTFKTIFVRRIPNSLRNLRLFSATTEHAEQDVPAPIENHAQERLLKLAVIGLPNAGKSTFINSLMNRKVCATSPKVHTTRCRARAVLTEGDAQIVFLDTPGIVHLKEKQKYKLEKSFTLGFKGYLAEADVVGVVHDVSNVYLRDHLDIKLVRLLEEAKDKPSFLVLNKIDAIKSKRKLLDIARLLTEGCLNGKPFYKKGEKAKEVSEYKGWPNFSEVFMVSALTGDGVLEVKDYLLESAKPDKWIFPSNIWTDQSAEQMILNTVKATLLQYLQQEIPYTLKPQMELFEVNKEGVIMAVVLVHCPSTRLAQLIAGEANGRLKQMTEDVQHNLQNTFRTFVRLRIVLQGPNKQ